MEFYDNSDDILAKWCSLFITTVGKHAPIKTHRVKHDIQPDWITSGILDRIKERDNLKKLGRHNEYKALRKEISVLIQSSKKSTYKSKIEAGNDDPKTIWKIFEEFGASK